MNTGLVMALTITASAAMGLGALVVRKLDQIHALVNSNLTQVKVDLASAVEEISQLRELLVREREKNNSGPRRERKKTSDARPSAP